MQNETIVDRVVQRLKAQPLGDLITEEDLHDIVKQAIPKTFFEPTKHNRGSASYPQWVDGEPVIVTVMRELLRESARDAVKNWMAANGAKLLAQWKDVTDAGLLKYVQQIQNEEATAMLKKGLEVWVNALNQERQKIGLPMIYPPV